MASKMRAAYQAGKSNVPYLGTKFDDNDVYYKELVVLLHANAPELLNRFRYVVIESTKRLDQKLNKLKQLEAYQLRLVGELESQPKSNWAQILLTIGLSTFLFLGIIHMFDLQPDKIFERDNLPITIISAIAAAAINIAERKMIESHAKYNFDVQRRNQKPLANGKTDSDVLQEENVENIFLMIWSGKSPILLAGAVVMFETAFVAAGLISLLTPVGGQANPIIIFAGSSLPAIINVALAWGDALAKSSWEKDYLYGRRSIMGQHFTPGANSSDFPSHARLKEINRRIREKKEEIRRHRRYAVGEFRRWEEDLKRYLKIQEFSPRNDAQSEYINDNGPNTTH